MRLLILLRYVTVIFAVCCISVVTVLAQWAPGTYGAGFRIVKVYKNSNGDITGGKVYGTAATIPFSNPGIHIDEGGHYTFAFVGSEVYAHNDPEFNPTQYIRWGWFKYNGGGNVPYLLAEWSDPNGIRDAWVVGPAPSPSPAAGSRFSFTYLDGSPWKHFLYADGVYKMELNVSNIPGASFATPMTKGYKTTAGIRTWVGVERAGSGATNYQTHFKELQFYKKTETGFYTWKSWANPQIDFIHNGDPGWYEDYHGVGLSDTWVYIWSSG